MTEDEVKAMIYALRRDLQAEYPTDNPDRVREFFQWWKDAGAKEYGLDTADNPQKNPEEGPKEVSLVGYSRAELGLGDHLRTAARALEAAGCKVNVVNFDHGLAQRQTDLSAAGLESEDLADIVIVCLSFDQLPYLFRILSPEALARRHVIAFSAWELSQLPVELLPTLRMADEIWTISHFMKMAVAPVSPVPVFAMPIAVETPAVDSASPDRASLGLVTGEFVFLTVFDAGSYLARKNPHDVVRAFLKAFPASSSADRPVRLVLKTHSAWKGQPGWDALVSMIESDPRITLIHECWEKSRLHALIAAADCLVSLHRAEGFGRLPAEAMLLGKPVILTGYSGIREYCGADNSFLVDYKLVPLHADTYLHTQFQAWADPDVTHAAELMRRIADGGPHVRRIAEKGNKTVRTVLDPLTLGTRYLERIRQIQRQRGPLAQGEE